MLVQLDPGHGGVIDGVYQTAGKRSPIWKDGSIYYEGEGNRDIVKRVAKKLDALCIGYSYVVRPDNAKDVSLTTRVKDVNAKHKERDKKTFLISVHSDGFFDQSANGMGVFVAPNASANSKKLADMMIKEMVNEFPQLKNRGVKTGNFAIIRDSNCPAILLESMFHTNEKECRILMSEEGRDKIADAIVRTIQKYMLS